MDSQKIVIKDEDNYIQKLNSDYWTIYHSLYKENDEDKYNKIKESIPLISIDKDKVFKRILLDIHNFSVNYKLILKAYLFASYYNMPNLENISYESLLECMGESKNRCIKDIDLNNMKLILKNNSITN